MRATRRQGLLVAALLPMILFAVAGVAYSYWVGSGGGSASAVTGTTQVVTLNPGTTSDQIFPGGQSAVAVTVTNPNPGAVKLGSLSLDTTQGTAGFGVDGAHSTCGVATLSFTTQTNGGAGWTIPASGSSVLSLASSLSMSTSAANDCQGASFTVYLKVGP